jgi:hypothetical protein
MNTRIRMTKEDTMQAIHNAIVDAMEQTFENDRCISCKEMAIMCLYACCPLKYQPHEFEKALQIIEAI